MEQKNISLQGELVEIKGTKYIKVAPDVLAEIAYFNEDGTPVLKTQVVTKDEGYDDSGNPKRSVNVIVQCKKLSAVTGSNG